MGPTIVPAGTSYDVKRLVVVVYGLPGSGKTTFALGADSPLMVDCDQGVARAVTRPPPARIEPAAWRDIASLPENIDDDFNTVIIDTVGTALDLLTSHLSQTDRRLTTSAGALSLQGYGALKATFSSWLRRLMVAGKDVVLVCHSTEKESNDNVNIRLDVQGSSRDMIYRVSHLLGYMHMHNNNKVFDLNPTDRWHGKNPAREKPIVTLPDGNQMADVISRAKQAIATAGVAANVTIPETRNSEEELSQELAKRGPSSLITDDAEDNGQDINDMMSRLEKKSILEEHNQKLKMLKNGNDKDAKRALLNSANQHGFAFDQQKKQFVL